ncbi:putative tRNA isopentenyltransferase [Pseudomassariella vexata]|uniref:tRNA dimethylallyltransferase n=1 Tax=Pseudomassariella vexata TaxID=1141098 RepID=A0A1Y2EKI4_9PEZI|nr:putative tRNA isopentenyltransferase [Pseudomassariella vexata]ORY72057.1 putative tRNA isopentenyltransferase [Pseudomassariella vexata]
MTSTRLLSQSFVRNAAAMAYAQRPTQPLVAIMGTTGTGKSDLAVDLAVCFDGEIINADAMQMYNGLPVITNQITAEEQRGVPHHLLATVKLDQPTWTVGVFAREASKLIREIRSRGKLPIVVGGTHYYVSSLLFENSLVDSRDLDDAESKYVTQTDIEKQHPILDGPTDLMLQRLREVDPAMASRWHPDDRRKIKRSLEIFLTTGKRASDIYGEQQQTKSNTGPSDSPWQSLMFWVYSKPDVLKERLDKRVDKMERVGLMEEVRNLHHQLRIRTESGEEVDRTRGIWQSIGFKQFEAFLDAERDGRPTAELDKLKNLSLDAMKIATRQYARQQLRWLRTKTIPTLEEKDATKYLYLLDSSDAEAFSCDVLSPAADITRKFLDGVEMPRPVDISETAKDVLSALEGSSAPKQNFEAKLCEICNMTLTTEDGWQKHINGRRHRRYVKSKSRMALVPVYQPASVEADGPTPPKVDLAVPG